MSDINSDYLDLVLRLQRASPEMEDHALITVVRELILANRKLHRLLDSAEQTPAMKQTERNIEIRLCEILKPFDATPIIGGDPRGCILKLKFPGSDSSAYPCWCVPL